MYHKKSKYLNYLKYFNKYLNTNEVIKSEHLLYW